VRRAPGGATATAMSTTLRRCWRLRAATRRPTAGATRCMWTGAAWASTRARTSRARSRPPGAPFPCPTLTFPGLRSGHALQARSWAPGAKRKADCGHSSPVLGLRAASPGCAAHPRAPTGPAAAQLCQVALARRPAERFAEYHRGSPAEHADCPPPQAAAAAWADRGLPLPGRDRERRRAARACRRGGPAGARAASCLNRWPAQSAWGIWLWQRSKGSRPVEGGRCQRDSVCMHTRRPSPMCLS